MEILDAALVNWYFFFSDYSRTSKLYTLGKLSVVWSPLAHPLHVIIEPYNVVAVRLLALCRTLLIAIAAEKGHR